MNDTTAIVLSAVLLAAGLAAELNLLRLYFNEWRAQRPRRKLRSIGRYRTSSTRQRRHTADIADRPCALAVCFLGGAISTVAPGQDNPAPPAQPEDTTTQVAPLVISTDRPSFSDSTGIAPVGHFQLETGYTFTFRNRDEVETQRHNAPEILARVGLIEDRFELRLLTSGYSWSRTDDSTGSGFQSTQGWNDVSLGLKLKMCDQDGWLPRLALGAQTTLGVGSDSVSNQSVEPTLKLIWSCDLGQSFGDGWKGLTLGGNANIAWPTSSGDRFTQGQGSIYLSFPIVDGLSGFAEYYAIGPNSKGSDAAQYVDVGGALLLNNRVQLDARVGFGLNQEADNVFFGVGISFLF
ncbi:MAG: transporter [Planctomycetes bacterium]|nr:transporter [Planctomycetota bacterium]